MWDEPKRQSNLRDHGLDFALAEERFEWDRAIILPTYPGKRGEARFAAVGFLDGQLVTLIYSPLGAGAQSFVSLRPSSRQERKLHAQR